MTPDIIEQASPADLDEIMVVEDACFHIDAFSHRQMAYLITHAKGAFLVARREDEIAGYISFITSRRHNTGRIYSIAVSPAHRSHGIGQALLTQAIDLACEQNLNAIFLEVRTDNTAAISLYEKNGFTKRTIFENYYHDGSPAYSMVLHISD